jgi:hypothetical protein
MPGNTVRELTCLSGVPGSNPWRHVIRSTRPTDQGHQDLDAACPRGLRPFHGAPVLLSRPGLLSFGEQRQHLVIVSASPRIPSIFNSQAHPSFSGGRSLRRVGRIGARCMTGALIRARNPRSRGMGTENPERSLSPFKWSLASAAPDRRPYGCRPKILSIGVGLPKLG